MQYRVRLMQTVIEETWITVDADTEDEAMAKAPEIAISDRVNDWRFYEMIGDIEAVECMAVRL